MPPKDTQPHELFISADGGETYKPLGLIVDDMVTDVPADTMMDQYEQNKEHFGSLGRTLTLSCTFNMRSNPSLFMLLWKGKWPSNNWLKMHGYPMRRKHRKRRC